MTQNKISSFEYGILVYFVIRSMSLGISINSYLYHAGVDGYMCPIIGFIIGFIPIYLIIKILNYKPELNINEKIKYLFGKKIGTFINIILGLFFIFFTTIIIWNLINFIGSQYLYKTSTTYIAIFLCICFLYISCKNIQVIARETNILFYVSVILFAICSISLGTQAKMDNLMPFLEFGFKGPIIGGIMHMIYSILPLFILLSIPKSSVKNPNNLNKNIIIFYIIGNLAKFVVIFLLISVFGIDLATLYEYPDYVLLRRISTGGFFQRFESLLAVQWFFDIYILITLLFYYIKNCYKSIFNVKNENLIVIFLLPIICLTNSMIFKNNTAGSLFILDKFPIIISIFLITIPIIIFITMKIKKNRTN